MGNIRIITDSASDMPVDYREDVTVVPLHVRFGTEEYLDGVNLSHREFYEKLIENEELPTTSRWHHMLLRMFMKRPDRRGSRL